MKQADSIAQFAENLKHAPDPFEFLSKSLAEIGVSGFFYGYSQALRDPSGSNFIPDIFAKHSYGAEWGQFAGPTAIATLDPSVTAMLGGERVVDWTIHDFHYDMMTPEQRKLIDFEHDLGMRQGASVLLELSRSRFAAMGLWFGDANTPAQYHRQWAQHGAQAMQMAQVFDGWICKEDPNSLIGLTAREMDCLAWLAHGMRPAEICHKMTISEKTFEKHIASAKQKLGARTRDQALARALLFGLI